MKIDLHTHCNPGSQCATVTPEELPALLKAAGLGGLVLTNHCYPRHCNSLTPDIKEQPYRYVEVFHRVKKAAEELGLKAFFGAEVTLINESKKMEFLLYGISEQDFIDSFPLYTYSQKELFDYCNQKNILMIQAHPFRDEQGHSPADPKYMHGIEALNGHLNFADHFEEAQEFIAAHHLLQTGGSDFHYPQQAGDAGMILPDTIEDQFMLRDYLRSHPARFFRGKKEF
jgi:predicted metal-dependent phosphoesterase TrpH